MAAVDSNDRVHQSSIDFFLYVAWISADFLGQNVGVGKIVGLFEAFVSKLKDVNF